MQRGWRVVMAGADLEISMQLKMTYRNSRDISTSPLHSNCYYNFSRQIAIVARLAVPVNCYELLVSCHRGATQGPWSPIEYIENNFIYIYIANKTLAGTTHCTPNVFAQQNTCMDPCSILCYLYCGYLNTSYIIHIIPRLYSEFSYIIMILNMSKLLWGACVQWQVMKP